MADLITKPIVLSWTQKDDNVMVETEDEDRYFMTVDEVIRACGAHGQGKHARCQEQFSCLMKKLFTWSLDKKETIKKAFVTVQDHGLLFLVITNFVDFNRDFEEKLTDLDIEIARDENYSEIDLSVQSLPDCHRDNYQSFCDTEFTLELKF